jgi:DNA-directed RNA polymerase specialized sigma24 family protein
LCAVLLPWAVKFTRDDEYAGVALLKLVRAFDPKKGTFKRWIYDYLRLRCCNERAAAEGLDRKRTTAMVPLDDFADRSAAPEASLSASLAWADAAETWTARAALHAMLVLGCTRAECAAIYGIKKDKLDAELHRSLAHLPVALLPQRRPAPGRGDL